MCKLCIIYDDFQDFLCPKNLEIMKNPEHPHPCILELYGNFHEDSVSHTMSSSSGNQYSSAV